jgi:hypothetical protein
MSALFPLLHNGSIGPQYSYRFAACPQQQHIWLGKAPEQGGHAKEDKKSSGPCRHTFSGLSVFFAWVSAMAKKVSQSLLAQARRLI